jgi:hypothetical protein
LESVSPILLPNNVWCMAAPVFLGNCKKHEKTHSYCAARRQVVRRAIQIYCIVVYLSFCWVPTGCSVRLTKNDIRTIRFVHMYIAKLFSSQDVYRSVVFPRNTLLSFSWEPKDLWRFAWWSSPLLWPPRHICMMPPVTGVSFLELYVGYMLCTRPWPPCIVASNFPGDIV